MSIPPRWSDRMPEPSAGTPRVYLLMALHCHQPVGNFGFVFDEAFRKAYEPFLAALERHPTVRVALHYSGSLLDWLAASQPSYLKRIRALVHRGQVEMLASGYYEPILPVIPEEDRQAQIALMRQALRKHFGDPAHGLWLTERVWEPGLSGTLARAGIQYTLLDDNQFRQAARMLPAHLQVRDEQGWDVLGAYRTDDAGASTLIFPMSKRLRYWIPFQEVSKSIEFLRRLARPDPVAITYADDGEKFGLWPNTHAWVYEQGWLEQFFTALEREASWLTTATFGQYAQTVGPSGQVYLPCGSYEEMLEWSGGYFRNFFVKYPESNAMQQKMLSLSQQLQAVAGSKRTSHLPRATRHSKLLSDAKRELYQAQCNDAYWHGVFGGLYLSHLRRAVYGHLLSAERLLATVKPSAPWEEQDVDGDGKPEVVVRNRQVAVVVDPDEDGTVTELSCFDPVINVADTLTRRPEAYHDKLKAKQVTVVPRGSDAPASIHDRVRAKEAGLEDRLVYDDHRRSSFRDYALSAMPTLHQVWHSTLSEHRLWSSAAWRLERPPQRATSNRTGTATLTRAIHGGRLVKRVIVDRTRPIVTFQYDVTDVEIPVVGLEWNVGLHNPQWQEPVWQEQVKTFRLRDESVGLEVVITIKPAAAFALFPIETVSDSEEGLERTPQGFSLSWFWQTAGQRRWAADVQWEFQRLR